MKLQNELHNHHTPRCLRPTAVEHLNWPKKKKKACLLCVNFKHSDMINSTLQVVSELRKMLTPFQLESLTDVQWVFPASTSTYRNLINTNLLSHVSLILLSFLTEKVASNCNNYNMYSWDGQSEYKLGWPYRLRISTGFLSSAKKILGQNKTRKPTVNFGHKTSSVLNPLMTPIYYILKIQLGPTVNVMEVCVDRFSTCHVQTQKTAGIMNIGRSFDIVSQISENGTHIYNKMHTTCEYGILVQW
jgi:hypothetical protein